MWFSELYELYVPKFAYENPPLAGLIGVAGFVPLFGLVLDLKRFLRCFSVIRTSPDEDELPDDTVVLPEPDDLDEDLLEPDDLLELFELFDLVVLVLVVFVFVVFVLEFELLLSDDASFESELPESDPEVSDDCEEFDEESVEESVLSDESDIVPGVLYGSRLMLSLGRVASSRPISSAHDLHIVRPLPSACASVVLPDAFVPLQTCFKWNCPSPVV